MDRRVWGTLYSNGKQDARPAAREMSFIDEAIVGHELDGEEYG